MEIAALSQQINQILESAQAGDDKPAKAAVRLSPPRRTSSRPLMIGAAVVALAVIGGLLYYLGPGNKPAPVATKAPAAPVQTTTAPALP